MDGLRVIAYASSAVTKLDEASLNDLLELARVRNHNAGVSGLLLYADGNFMQYLEGAADLLSPIWKSIQRDSRHRGLYVLLDGETSEREFDGWSMAYGVADLPAFLSLTAADWRSEAEPGATNFPSGMSPGRRLIRAMWSAMLPATRTDR